MGKTRAHQGERVTEGRDDTTVHGLGVLTNLDLLERVGAPTTSFLEALGETRESLSAGARVEWDRCAALFDRERRALGAERAGQLGTLMADAITDPNPMLGAATTQRECFECLVSVVIPLVWPIVRVSLEDRGRGLALLSLEVPAPRVCPWHFIRLHVEAFTCFPRHAGLSDVRVLDLSLREDERRGEFLLELTDELVRGPERELGDAIGGQAVVITLDIADLTGVDAGAWLTRHGLSRATLFEGAPVRWDAYRELVEELERVAGSDGYRDACRHVAQLSRGVGAMVGAEQDLATVYAFLCAGVVASFWGPLEARLEQVWSGCLYHRLQVRQSYAGCRAFLASHVGTLEGLTHHRGLPPARVRAWLDDDGTGATYLIELPDEGPSVLRSAALRPPDPSPNSQGLELFERTAVEAVRTRNAARASVVERIGRELTTASDVHSIAEVVLRAAMDALALDGIELALASGPSGELVPVRSRGACEGTGLVRSLDHRAEPIGQLRVWVPLDRTGETLAALDLLTPWIAVALGTAILSARERQARETAQSESRGLRHALDGVLALHPAPAYVLGATGEVEAANEAAARALRDGPGHTLNRIASAVGDGTESAFDILPIRIAGRTDRIVVIERGARPTFESRIAIAAERWSLTRRQREVVDAVARGMSNKEIASALDCAEVTVENHLTTIYRKAKVDGRNRLVADLMSL